jgi:CelD/BcsL family acetyltransferase involved in cellulose biosynthesis
MKTDAITVEPQRDPALPPELRERFDDLVAAHPRAGVFVSPAWLRGFFSLPPEDSEVSLVKLTEGGTLRGVVPIVTRRRATHVQVGLLGGGAGSDRVDLLAERGFEAACAERFLRWLGETHGAKGFVLELRDVPAESALWGAIRRINDDGAPSLVLEPREIHPLPYLDLDEVRAAPGRGGLSADKAKSLEKHVRWLAGRGGLVVDRPATPEDAASAFESLSEFLRRRWERHGTSALDRPEALAFHRGAIPALLSEGRLRMLRLTVGGRVVAVYYGLAAGGWWGYYLAGYDREWAGRIHLGRVLLASAIDAAIEEGAREFDFLKGAERVKYHWPVRERTTMDADVYSHAAGTQWERAAVAGREATRALAKSMKDLLSKKAP